MPAEQLCLEILRALHGKTAHLTNAVEGQALQVSEEQNALTETSLVRPLLARYELPAIDAAIRWLWLGEYIGKTSWGFDGPWVHALRPKGVQAAEAGRFSDEERALFYGGVRPYQVFLARQFSDAELELVEYLRDRVLLPAGYAVVDGQAEGLEEFRKAILSKIAGSQFFVCLLTRRSELIEGGFASSVWLYQEIGAAVALGKRPLVLVENGMHAHYAGELQKTYEYVPFTREAYQDPFDSIIRRFESHLLHVSIPLPTKGTVSGRGHR